MIHFKTCTVCQEKKGTGHAMLPDSGYVKQQHEAFRVESKSHKVQELDQGSASPGRRHTCISLHAKMSENTGRSSHRLRFAPWEPVRVSRCSGSGAAAARLPVTRTDPDLLTVIRFLIVISGWIVWESEPTIIFPKGWIVKNKLYFVHFLKKKSRPHFHSL